MTRFKVRFPKPLYPGEPMTARIWKIDDGEALFRTLNPETGDIILDQGIVDLICGRRLFKVFDVWAFFENRADRECVAGKEN